MKCGTGAARGEGAGEGGVVSSRRSSSTPRRAAELSAILWEGALSASWGLAAVAGASQQLRKRRSGSRSCIAGDA